MEPNKIQKTVKLSPNLYGQAVIHAKTLGLSFTEYIRFLLAKEIDRQANRLSYVDEETERNIGIGLNDLHTGKVSRARSPKEINQHLDSL